MSSFLLFVVLPVATAIAFVLVGRRIFRKADEAARMRATVQRLELAESKQKRDADEYLAGAAHG